MKNLLRAFILTAVLAAFAFVPMGAYAEFPGSNITVVVGYGPGGGTDITARVVAKYLEKYLPGSATVVVKNVEGAGGVIALTQVSNKPADGYTIATFNVPASIGRMKDRKTSYSLDSFEFLSGVTADPNALLSNAKSDIKTLDDLKKICESGKKLTLSFAGFGGEDHFAADMIEKALGCSFTYVPMGGDGKARTALMGNHVQLSVVNVSAAYNYRDKLNFIGVMSSGRSEYVNDVPTFHEMGYDIEMASTRGYVVPKGTPKEVIKIYEEAFRKMFTDQEFINDMQSKAVPTLYMDHDTFTNMAVKQDSIITQLWNSKPWK